ncbi:MAG: 4Fe-4S dicluster domain-containing protein [Candidatus Izimaplasma sp.]|nr:4Fe-4S dicluster domain-containing protein [Candidatus Izimaplasma bacterium]
MKKYDERETLFSRIALQKNTKEYEEFYKKHPSLKYEDDQNRNRNFRENLRKSVSFKEQFFPIIAHNKAFIKSIFLTARNYDVNNKRQKVPLNFSENIKEITKYFGATNVGITKLNAYSYYSHSGGLSNALNIENYNRKIVPRYITAIVFTVKMDQNQINRAPNFEELLATEQGYLNVAVIASRLTMYLKSLGYKAEQNNSEYYLAPLVPLAYDAGLGEIGMLNHLVTKKHGDNVRLGAVFTTLKLDYDKPEEFGLKEFCKQCTLCLMNCPSHAITHKPRIVNNRHFYKFDENKCFEMWQKTGTDCGICIQSCPFTQGVDQEKVSKMKNNKKVMKAILDEHFEKYGRRNYTKEELKIVRMDDDDKRT